MYQVVQTAEDFYAMLMFLIPQDVLFCDIETTGLDPYQSNILLISIKGGDKTYVIDMIRLPEAQKYELSILFTSNQIKVFHNAVFDYKHIYHALNIKILNIACTLITDQLINSGLDYTFDLAEVVRRRFGVELDKSTRIGFVNRDIVTPFTEEELTYAAKDSDILEALYNAQLKDIEEKNLRAVYELECKLIPTISMMEYEGICVDIQRLEYSLPITQKLLDKIDKSIQDDVIGSGLADQIVFHKNGYTAINVRSSAQMLEYFHKIGINVVSMNNKDLSDWDANWAASNKQDPTEVVNNIENGEDDEFHIGFSHPVLRKRAIYTAAKKLQSTYIEGLLSRVNPVTGRIHPGFKQCGAVSTGRMSSVSPNFQNLPRMDKLKAIGLPQCDIRSMFIPAPGNVFIICDYAGIELVILAIMSGDKKLISELLRGDIHAYVANNLEGHKIKKIIGDLITKNNKSTNPIAKYIRDSFKSVSYGIAYGSTGYNMYRTLCYPLLSQGLVITPKDADRWVHDWKTVLFPDTGELLKRNSEFAITRGYTESILGRRRYWDVMNIRRGEKWKMFAAMREGMNHPIQGSSADMTKLAMVLLSERLDNSEARIVAAIHDEILVESSHEYSDEAARLTQLCMQEAGYLLFPDAERGLINAEPKKSDRYDK